MIPTPLNERGIELFRVALGLLPGLLASGHFTYPAESDDDAGLQLDDLGEEWYEYALCKRPPTAISCALSLVDALEEACWCETTTEPEQRDYFDKRILHMQELLKQKAERIAATQKP